MIALVLLGAPVALLVVILLAAAYQPQPAQCPAHYDCDTPAACTAVLVAEAATAGYPDAYTVGGEV